jgi:hypothetical protein
MLRVVSEYPSIRNDAPEQSERLSLADLRKKRSVNKSAADHFSKLDGAF